MWAQSMVLFVREDMQSRSRMTRCVAIPGLLVIMADVERQAMVVGQLRKQGYPVIEANNGAAAGKIVGQRPVALALIDGGLPEGAVLPEWIRRESPTTAVIVLDAGWSEAREVAFLSAGAQACFAFPVARPARLQAMIVAAMCAAPQVIPLHSPRKGALGKLKGNSPALLALIESIRLLAPLPDPILVLGESGVGKELVSRAIHEESAQQSGPLVTVNCAAIKPDLFESELFGHREGSFTGATRDRPGLLEAARGGTLFLDEIGDLPPELQAKLLRVLEIGEYRPVGAERTRRVEARIIAATNRDLHAGIERGEFREDLYFRLSGLEIQVPPLRERREDITLLAWHFLDHYSQRFRRPALSFSDSALKRFRVESWTRNNVRELEWTIRQAVARSRGGAVLTPESLRLTGPTPQVEAEDELLSLPYGEALLQSRERFVRRYLHHCLERADHNKARAAELAGMDRANFHRLLRKMNIQLPAARKIPA